MDCAETCPVPPPSPPPSKPFTIIGLDGYAVIMWMIFTVLSALFLIGVCRMPSKESNGKRWRFKILSALLRASEKCTAKNNRKKSEATKLRVNFYLVNILLVTWYLLLFFRGELFTIFRHSMNFIFDFSVPRAWWMISSCIFDFTTENPNFNLLTYSTTRLHCLTLWRSGGGEIKIACRNWASLLSLRCFPGQNGNNTYE